MRNAILPGTTLLVLLAATAARVQAQAVQLPSFQQTTVDTSVLVPDRGSMVLGGVSGGSSQMRANGPSVLFPQRGIGLGSSASSMQMHVQIHDFEAMDAAVLSAARKQRALQMLPHPEDVKVSPDDPLPDSVAEIVRQRKAAAAAQQADAERYLAEGRHAEEIGKPNVARVYYRMVERRATGEPRREALARLQALETPLPGSTVARPAPAVPAPSAPASNR